MKELRQTYLVQRLEQPRGYDNPFSFGGGLRNGGLSEEAMKLLRNIFSFDYMGSAEFEFGAVPECFQKIAKDIKGYSMNTLTINKLPVYVMCKTEDLTPITQRVNELAQDKVRCKEFTGFPQALGLSKYSKKEDCRTFGWLELNNNFLFFTDKEMADKMVNLFEL